MGPGAATFAREPFSAGVGMLPNLFRVGHRQNHGRRPGVAKLHGAGRVLPEWAAADLDRMAHATPAALVPCGDGVWDAGAGISASVDEVSAAAFSRFGVSVDHALAGRHHSLS